MSPRYAALIGAGLALAASACHRSTPGQAAARETSAPPAHAVPHAWPPWDWVTITRGVAGTVRTMSDAPVPGRSADLGAGFVTLFVKDEHGHKVVKSTDVRGTFAFALPAGRYELCQDGAGGACVGIAVDKSVVRVRVGTGPFDAASYACEHGTRTCR